MVELLVVIAIISLLMAILLPALRKVRQVSRRIKCSANLRNISTAWAMYLDDHEGAFYQGRNASFNYGGWKGMYFPNDPRPLNPYVHLPATFEDQNDSRFELFHCPEDNGRQDPFGTVFFDEIGTSYQTNPMLIGNPQMQFVMDPNLMNLINSKMPGLNITSVFRASEVLLIGDSEWVTQWMPKAPDGINWHYKKGCFNMAFLDSHTEFLKIEKNVHTGPGYRVVPFDLAGH